MKIIEELLADLKPSPSPPPPNTHTPIHDQWKYC